MDRDRRAAYLVLKDIEEDASWSNLSLAKQFSIESPASPAFVRELVYGVLRNQFLLDFNIDGFLKKPNIKSGVRILLRMGFYQMAYMDVADHAAINETVNLAKSFMKGSEPFINAVLRAFQRSSKRIKLSEDANIVKRFSVNYSCNKDIVEHLLKYYEQAKTEEILKSFLSPAPLSIRVNSLKTTKDALVTNLNAKGFDTALGRYSDTCVYVKGSGLLDTTMYKDGLFFVQGEASMLAALKMGAKPEEIIADFCSAPGGKAMSMAIDMENKGKIIACDLYPHRLDLITKQAKRLGISIVDTKTLDSTKQNFGLDFDAVLCDVPCTGLGTSRRNPEIKLKTFDDTSILSTQKMILENASLCAKDRIVYSTCTINPKENEIQVKDFIKTHDNWTLEYEKQFFPEDNGPDGFYISLLKRK